MNVQTVADEYWEMSMRMAEYAARVEWLMRAPGVPPIPSSIIGELREVGRRLAEIAARVQP